MKAQIFLAVLLFSAAPLLANEPGLLNAVPVDAQASAPPAGMSAESPIAVAAAAAPEVAAPVTVGPLTGPPMAGPPIAGPPVTAAPIIVGPDGAPLTSQYQPPMIVPPGAGPSGCPTCGPGGGPMPVPYGAPYAAPYPVPVAPPGGLIDPGMCEQVFPYKALTPDVTMVPTTAGGPIPDRYGWVQLYDVGFLPYSSTRGDFGHLSVFEFDAAWKYITPLYPSPLIFSFTPQYDLRLWGGLSPPSPAGVPDAVHRFGLDLELKSALPGPLNAVIAFNPSIDSDFDHQLTRNAWNWDGRAAFLYSPSRDLTFVLGALFWDRIHERVLPWAGMIYRPNPYWQFDLVFPQFRVSTYLWDEFGFKTSLYARIEYHSEAYQVSIAPNDRADRVEIDDWRALIGFDKDRGDIAYFVEGGWVFARGFHLQNVPDGNITVDSGAIVRAGIRF